MEPELSLTDVRVTMSYIPKMATSIGGLTICSLLVLLAGFGLARQETRLFPGSLSELGWFHATEPAAPMNQNLVKVVESGEDSKAARFSFHISPDQELPYTSYIIYFSDPASVRDLTDLSQYDAVSFKIKCDPKNILVFALYSYAEGVTSIRIPKTYRVSSDFFTCNSQVKEVSFPLRSLDSAIWWVERYGIEYSNLDADLKKVHGIAFNNSLQSPRGIESDFLITDLKLIKEDDIYLYVSIGIVAVMWLLGFIFMARLYIEEVIRSAKSKINDNRPLVAYQQLSLQQKDESLKTKLLQHIAVQYCNSDISIDGVADILGTNRVKINEILKSELGLTFTSYINRLRLTEAARLLALQKNVSVKQIAFEVGFSNVTYFSTLFKKEYGCTPKAFANNKNKGDRVDI